MADPRDANADVEDDYDEGADSDFEEANISDQTSSSSSEEDDAHPSSANRRPSRPTPRTQKGKKQSEPLELDSGDEATIEERTKARKKQQKPAGDDQQDDASDDEEQGWRARTRAMRQKDQDEKRQSRLASVKGSTINVDEMWEMMNRPGGLGAPLDSEVKSAAERGGIRPSEEQHDLVASTQSRSTKSVINNAHDTERPHEEVEDMITIEETYEFAGEIHSRKQIVPRSSAEAKLWLSQRPSRNTDSRFPGDKPIRRPLRKLSRFDPNLNNLDPFRTNWEKPVTRGKGSKVHKINTVEKSKMDWEAHVDREGLQDELREHAKAKEGYLGRMDFLEKVEQRTEEEARKARMKGR
jgi:Bucentaur or craniofacial development